MNHWPVHLHPRYAVLLTVMLLAACVPLAPTPAQQSAPTAQTQASAPTVASVPPTAVPAAQPVTKPAVNRLVLALNPPLTEHNDVRHLGQFDTWQIKPIYEYLIGTDPNTGGLVPQLATEWRIEDNGTSVRFLLRNGVQFQKGFGEFTAADVVFSWQDVAREDSLHGESRYWRTLVKQIDVINDYEVVFRLARPDGNFIPGISEAQSGMEMRSKAHFDSRGAPTMETEPLVGTGPVQYKERRQASMVLFEQTPGPHWRQSFEFPELELRFQREASTRLAGLLAGEIHGTTLSQDLMAEAQTKGFQVLRNRAPLLRAYLGMSCCFVNQPGDPAQGYKNPDSPLMDVRVRRALNKAINRDELNKAFFAGKGETMVNSHFHPTWPGWNPEWEKRFPDEYGFDPAKARELLTEAGKVGLTTNVFVHSVPQYAGAEDVVESIAGYWDKIGIKVERLQMDTAQIAAGQREFKFTNHLRPAGTQASQLLSITVFATSYGPRGGAYEDPGIDAPFLQLRDVIDPSSQGPYFRAVGDAMFEQHGSIPLYWLPSEILVSPRVIGEYVFPGAVASNGGHITNIKPSRS